MKRLEADTLAKILKAREHNIGEWLNSIKYINRIQENTKEELKVLLEIVYELTLLFDS